MKFNQEYRMLDALRKVERGVVISLRVVPNASKTGIDGYDDWKKSLKFKTKKPAKDNLANRSILKFFSAKLGRKTVLLSGAKSNDKEILILGSTIKEVSGAIEKDKK